MNRTQVRTQYRELQGKYPELAGYRLVFSNTKRTLGQCFYELKEIRISQNHLDYSSDDSVRDTLLHECAHAHAYEKHGRAAANHGYLWKQSAVLLGANPAAATSTAYTEGRPPSKYTLRCSCGNEGQRHRMAKGSQYRCGVCGARMEVIQNW